MSKTTIVTNCSNCQNVASRQPALFLCKVDAGVNSLIDLLRECERVLLKWGARERGREREREREREMNFTFM